MRQLVYQIVYCLDCPCRDAGEFPVNESSSCEKAYREMCEWIKSCQKSNVPNASSASR